MVSGFLDELSKLADDKAPRVHPAVSGGAALVGGTVMDNLWGSAGSMLGPYIEERGAAPGVAGPEQVERLKGLMGVPNVEVHDVGVESARFVPGKGTIGTIEDFLMTHLSDEHVKDHPQVFAPTDLGHNGQRVIGRRGRLDILAHELGHAKNYTKTIPRMLSRNRGPMHILGMAATPMAAIASGDSEWADYAAPGLAAASFTPTMIDEGLASRNAMKGLRQLGSEVSPAQIRGARNKLLAAYGSYGLGAAGAVGSALAARKIKRHLAQPAEGTTK